MTSLKVRKKTAEICVKYSSVQNTTKNERKSTNGDYSTKSTKCSLFQTTRDIVVNKTDLRALTLAGPTRKNPVQDPLAVLHLDNQLHIINGLF